MSLRKTQVCPEGRNKTWHNISIINGYRQHDGYFRNLVLNEKANFVINSSSFQNCEMGKNLWKNISNFDEFLVFRYLFIFCWLKPCERFRYDHRWEVWWEILHLQQIIQKKTQNTFNRFFFGSWSRGKIRLMAWNIQ